MVTFLFALYDADMSFIYLSSAYFRVSSALSADFSGEKIPPRRLFFGNILFLENEKFQLPLQKKIRYEKS